MFEPLLTPLFSSLLSPLIAATQRILITLDAAQQGHFALENPIVETGDFAFSFDIFKTDTTTQSIVSSTIDSNNFISIPSTGAIEVRIAGTFVATPSSAFNYGQLNTLCIARVGSTVTIIQNGISVGSGTAAGTFPLNQLAKAFAGAFLDGIIANVDLGNGNAWQLNRLTGNTEQAANGNNLLTYVNIPTGAPDRELFTLNTSTTPNQWENADKSRIIQVA